jgi:hypothetical protein
MARFYAVGELLDESRIGEGIAEVGDCYEVEIMSVGGGSSGRRVTIEITEIVRDGDILCWYYARSKSRTKYLISPTLVLAERDESRRSYRDHPYNKRRSGATEGVEGITELFKGIRF